MPGSLLTTNDCGITRDKQHRYFKDGRHQYTAASRILEVEGLKAPYRDAPEGEDPEAYRNRGHAAHLAVNDRLGDHGYQEEDYHPIIHPYVHSWDNWADHVGGVELVACSLFVCSDLHRTAGELDLLLRPLRPKRKTDRLWVVDLKTTTANGGMPEAYVGPQMGAYSSMLLECFGIKVDALVCVLLRNSGKPDSTTFDVSEMQTVWRSAVNMYHYKDSRNLIPKNLRAA